jgi:diguanylate cyclase (GGDEF)-like protein
MEWLDLHFLFDSPAHGQVVLHSSHDAVLVLLAYLIASAAGFTTLDMAERVASAKRPKIRLLWRWGGALCLAGGIWAMHFIAMLAYQAPIPIHYDLSITAASLLVAFIAALLAMHSLGRTRLRASQYLLASVSIGLGIATMHYSGMAALRSAAHQHYQPGLFALSILIAIVASLAALLLARYFRQDRGRFNRLLKYAAALVMGAAIVSMHFTGMAALSLTVPSGTPLQLQSADNSLQLGLAIALIALLIIGSGLGSAWADKKLESKERDLQRLNALLAQLDQARASLQQVAHFDSLTGLLNRRGFNQAFGERLAEHARTGRPLAVLLLDIDRFKRINDSLGHDAGDELLAVIAERLQDALRDGDLVARFGGDEFCVLLDLHTGTDARHLAQRLLRHLQEPIDLAGRNLVMTASIGISLFPQDGTHSDELLKHADLALYQAKGSGRNNLHFFSSHLKTKATFELQLEEELRHALQNDDELLLYYQPILDMRLGEVRKLEALVRWQHPQLGLLTPDRFIGIAEAHGLIAKLDNWVMRRACRDLRTLSQAGFEQLRVAVNCSALNLGRAGLVDEVQSALRDTGVAPQRLELEVTENALMGNINQAAALLQQLRVLGVLLSIDDFGTGYSSLAYLKRLPLDTLKIDRCFIQDIPESPQDMEIVQAVLGMAHTLQLKVVAEGVESAQQLAFLHNHGCDFVQGYLLSRPLPLAQVQDYLSGFHTPAVLLTPRLAYQQADH